MPMKLAASVLSQDEKNVFGLDSAGADQRAPPVEPGRDNAMP
jgi:hypothetical protein